MRQASVGLVYGFWGQNIGNAFFNLGGQWLLEEAFGPGTVVRVQDAPGYRTFYDQEKGNPPNWHNTILDLELDYLVLQGPCLTESFDALWRETLTELGTRGTQVILLGAALFTYTAAEIAAARHVITTYQPAAVITRDARSYEALQAVEGSTRLFNGIDSAFAMPFAASWPGPGREPLVALTFDRYPEPTITVATTPSTSSPGRAQFDFGGFRWTCEEPAFLRRIARLGKWQAYIGATIDRRPLPLPTGTPYQFVRPHHRTNPFIASHVYKRPGSTASDEPFTYGNIYSQAVLTLTDRVHAAVATLAFGGSAMLFTPSPRASLFARLCPGDIHDRPMTIDRTERDEILAAEVALLKELR